MADIPLECAIVADPYMKLPIAVVLDVGSAAQTMGGLLRCTTSETFQAVAGIADNARLPIRTVKRHLDLLEERGWLVNAGRQQTQGRTRRTCTWQVAPKATEAAKEFLILPEWAADVIPGWSACVLLAVVCGQCRKLKSAVAKIHKDDAALRLGVGWHRHLWDVGGVNRFQYSLSTLEKLTGLSRRSVIDAKRTLNELRIIDIEIGGVTTAEADILLPVWRSSVRLHYTKDGTRLAAEIINSDDILLGIDSTRDDLDRALRSIGNGGRT